ncbi:MAG: hypothetical protein M3494_08935 [Actinomycetota bacterium]|jgi:hypothetical protein|nr:hypothetical protein [Rubrobacter sp.]MDQ3508125.1 hypothetical protein [Actinomycetota bacterium]
MDARDIDTKVGKDAGRGIGVFVAAGAMALFFVYRARYAAVLNEDAFVPFRYARSPLAGDGLVFNPGGERVEGITNLLWTLALAGASGASGMPLPEVSVLNATSRDFRFSGHIVRNPGRLRGLRVVPRGAS